MVEIQKNRGILFAKINAIFAFFAKINPKNNLPKLKCAK